MKEYGGFLPLELSKGKEYFDDVQGMTVLPLNCGRSAFFCAVKDSGARKAYMPYLNCPSTHVPIEIAGAEIEYYYLDDDLTPKGIAPSPNEMVLWINYYGNANEQEKSKVIQKYPNLIIDNCHAFFSEPVTGAYNCYSTRKYFGVCDGTYLIKDNLYEFSLELDQSYKRAEYLLKTIEMGTNFVYQDYLKNEEFLAKRVLKMSKLTHRILQVIPYETIKKIRFNNFMRLHYRLGHINEFTVNIHSGTHIHYPLLVTDDYLRERLIENRIYTPTWWRHVPNACEFSETETKLSNYMLMLPIDQRYNLQDMDDIANIVLREHRIKQ